LLAPGGEPNRASRCWQPARDIKSTKLCREFNTDKSIAYRKIPDDIPNFMVYSPWP
jgi:hypothetical protein